MDRPLTLNVGADADRLHELRQGFVNNNGDIGALRRNEDDFVTSADVYAEARWDVLPALSLTLGVRSSQVRYDSTDHYVVGINPDDSGKRNYYNTSPIAGVVWHAMDNLNVYCELWTGIRDTDLRGDRVSAVGHRPQPGSRSGDFHRVRSRDEVASDRRASASISQRSRQRPIRKSSSMQQRAGARRTATRARRNRRGFEAVWDAALGYGIVTHVNYTYLLAEFADAYVAGIPPVVTPAGSRLPGVPPQQAFGVLEWTPGGWQGFSVAGEVQYVGRIYVNDTNTAFAPAYTIGNLRVGFAQDVQRFKISEYVRVNNIANVNYVGSVIVGDTNSRYYEPAPGRNWYAGVSVSAAF